MITVTDGKDCEVCGRKGAVVICNGCGKSLCEDCRTFDIWCFGCGHGDPKAFCRVCYEDPLINIWKSP